MKHFPLVLLALLRKPVRTLLSAVALIVAFLLFGLLQGVNAAFQNAIQTQKLDRLFVDSRFIGALPVSYRERIEKVPGVAEVAQIVFIPGHVQDPRNNVLAVATDALNWLSIRPEYQIAPEQVQALTRTRDGAIVGQYHVQTFGWKIGDRVSIRSPIPRKDGRPEWSFQVVGIYANSEAVRPERFFLTNYEYLEESRTDGHGLVSRYLLKIEDLRYAARVARDIDTQFANSPAPTRTQTEQEMAQSQAAGLGDLSFFTASVLATVAFTLLALTGHTMTESVRERTAELAVLKTLGFSDGRVMLMVVAEAILLCVVAAAIGLVLAWLLFPVAKRYVPVGNFPLAVLLQGIACAALVGVASAAYPAWRALRLQPARALAQV
jgi:putative ABC transport system permease protein